MPELFTLVETNEALAAVIEALREAPIVALDTEADSLHHFREKVCLIQLTCEGRHWIVDPLAPGIDVEPLVRLLEIPQLLLHGADYDLRLLYRAWGFCPRGGVFDTMLGAQMLGWEQIGLAAVVANLCGVTLSKHGQRADWSQRPIPGHLLDYASDDTRYLPAVAQAMAARLDELGRLDWHRECCRRVLGAACQDRAPEAEDPWRIRGGRHLAGRGGAILRELWSWRDGLARRLDRPPFKIMNNEVLLAFATWGEANPETPAHEAPPPPTWLRGDRLHGFQQALARALGLEPSDWPGPPAHNGGPRLSREEEAQLSRLLAARDEAARALALSPGVLGPRDALRQWMLARPRTAEELLESSPLMPWQTVQLAPLLAPLFGIEALAPDCEPGRPHVASGEPGAG